ncbi:lamin tail domain-containing protein [Halocola ammonii]
MRITLTFLTILLGSQFSFAQLYINEIMASNSTTIADNFDEYDDWIEIYNGGSVPVNLAGYYLSDDAQNLTQYQIPTDASLFVTQGNHILIWTDNDITQGPDHTNFRLSGGDGETIILTDPDGTTIIDQVDFGQQQTDISYGRESDGAENWIFFNSPTPEETNQEAPQETQLLFINEVLSVNQNNIDDQANEHEPWFEIYNPNAQQVNLAGYYVSYNGSELFQIPSNDPVRTTVEGNDFIVFWADGDLGQGANHTEFEISSGDGDLVLYGLDGSSIVDEYSFPDLDSDVSYGRSTDGGLNSILFDIPTPRVTNTLIIIEPEEIYINELLAANMTDIADNVGEFEDWFELYNPNPYPVNLAGYYLTDDQENPTKFQITTNNTDSTTIQPGDWMLFYADEDQEQGVNHVNFRLNNAGEELALYGPDGFSLADEINFVDLATDESLGRLTDGGPNWVTFIGTTPDASNEGGTVSVKEPGQEELRFEIYPNPNQSGVLYFGRIEKEIQIFSASGSLVKTIRNQNSTDVSALKAGVYFVKNDSGQVARLVVTQ